MIDLVLATSGGEAQAAGGGYVDDVFSAYTYTGNGSTQTINNGIDLAGKGGLVWTKNRGTAQIHFLTDTIRGASSQLYTNNTNAAGVSTEIVTSFNSNGFSLGQYQNENIQSFVSWTFRRGPKFFDVVTYTGNGASNRALSHQLNADVGMVMVKATSTTGDWWVFHRSATGDLVLNTTAAQTASKANIPSATSSTFTVNGSANTSGVQYVAYLFAHDPSADGIIQCGSFSISGGTTATVNVGFEPQFLVSKRIDSTQDWQMFDSMRQFGADFNASATLLANTSGAETAQGTTARVSVTSTGFRWNPATSTETHIYLAIRRSNKPPTTGTQVYNAIARTGTSAAATVTGVGFAPDALIVSSRNSAGNPNAFLNRLVGASSWIESNRNTMLSEQYNDAAHKFLQDGVYWNNASDHINNNTISYINHFFRRAKGFFDIVCDTGTGVAHSVNHGLSAAPEFIIRKSRSGATQWDCWHSALAATEKLVLNFTAAKVTDTAAWNSTFPTSTQFTVGTGANVNTNAATYVTYLFATLAGISKVGSYTGNGTSQTINCGFSTGSRFILVKRTDATGDWYVWDSVRGIIAANDPHLSLNTTAAEVTTDDSVDPEAGGFIVNQNTATNINVNGGQYIFLAIA